MFVQLEDRAATDETLSFAEAAKRLPSINGKRVHASALWRWARKGLHGVHLEVRRVGHRFVVTPQSIEQFTKQLAALPYEPRTRTPRPEPTAATETPTQFDRRRTREVESAKSYLRSVGCL